MVDDPPNILLEVHQLGFRYGARRVLDDVSFGLQAGTFTVLLGPNGAGKTTLFSLITRLLDGADGQIRIGGRRLHDHPSAALRRIGVVFQQSTLDLDLTVQQNMDYHGALHGLAPERVRERTRVELTRLDMGDRLQDKVRRLNGGHRRRVEIARALLHEPDVLLLDEPTVGLDVPTRTAIVEHVHQLCGRAGTTVLWATHLIDEVADDDRVVLLHQGRLQAHGPVREVIADAGAQTLGEAFSTLTAGRGAQ